MGQTDRLRRLVRRGPACLVLLLATLTPGGCARVPPPVTEVEGVLLLDGKPLPHAVVEFMPELSNFGAEMNSTGVTDEAGHFTLSCTFKSQPGATVGRHRVVVSDEIPADTRGQSAEAQIQMTDWMRKLKNRPIPDAYQSAGTTPLMVDVKPEQKTYELTMRRRPS